MVELIVSSPGGRTEAPHYILKRLDSPEAEQVPVRARVLSTVGSATAFLDSSDPETGTRAIMEALEEARGNALHLRCIEALSNEGGPEPDADMEPERAGTALAERVRQALGGPAEPLRTWETLASMLDEDPKPLEAVLRPCESLAKAPSIDGVVTRAEDGSPALAFRERSTPALRFHFCRALAEVVAAPQRSALLTEALTDRQERSRAFAAELLASASWLAEQIAGPVAKSETIEELTTELDVAPRVELDQLIRHRIARVPLFGWGWR